MGDGSQAIARKSMLPAEQSEERPSVGCPRCEGMELVDCDLCEDGLEGCSQCEGLGLMDCPACDVPADMSSPAVLSHPEPRLCNRSLKQVSKGQASVASRTPHRAEVPTKKLSRVARPGPQPAGTGAAGCASRLKWARQRLRMSVEDLAQIASYSPGSLRSYEQGQPASGPPLRAIEDLAQALGVRRSWLAFGLGSVETAQRPQSLKGERRDENKFMEAAR